MIEKVLNKWGLIHTLYMKNTENNICKNIFCFTTNKLKHVKEIK
jgi:general stress protein 26